MIIKLASIVIAGAAIAVIPSWSSGPMNKVTPRTFEELVRLQQSVQEAQSKLDQGRDELEADRRRWAERERKDPIIAAVVQGTAMLLACLLPLVAALIVLWPRRSDSGDAEIIDTLLLDASSPEPKLLISASSEESKERIKLT